MDSRLRIIVTGLIAQHPRLGGVTWDYLQYVLGLVRLGHDVYYFEDSGQWPYNPDGGPSGENWIADDPARNVDQLARVMSRAGLEEKWAYHFPIRSRWYGLSQRVRRNVITTADLLLNVSGTLGRPLDYRAVPRLIYIDSDPVFTQVRLSLPRGQTKFRKRFEAHDLAFSFGEHFSAHVPETGVAWHPTRQPIVLSEWRPTAPRREVYTTVMSWTSYKPLVFKGRRYGQKDVEFKRFLTLPCRVHPVALEVALGQQQHVAWQTNDDGALPLARDVAESPTEWTPPELLRRTGWRVVDSAETCPDLDSYRRYVESSKGEWSVAKNGYVIGQSGWFSCRSACYLAAGRPVIVQDTGCGDVLPVGEGILTFGTLEEAAAAIHEVEAEYKRHAEAARGIAEAYFDSDKVLSRLIDIAMNPEVPSASLTRA